MEDDEDQAPEMPPARPVWAAPGERCLEEPTPRLLPATAIINCCFGEDRK